METGFIYLHLNSVENNQAQQKDNQKASLKIGHEYK